MKEEITEVEDTNLNHDSAADSDIVYEDIAKLYGKPGEHDHAGVLKTVNYLHDLAMNMTNEEALEVLANISEEHTGDPNFPWGDMERIQLLLQGPKVAQMDLPAYDSQIRVDAAVMGFHSPYPEVRSVTEPMDDPDTPAETIRAYIIGLGWMAILSISNVILSLRQPDTGIGPDVVPLVLAPTGKFFARVLPDWGFNFRGKRISLNPGPWTYKEQVFATIMFTIASGGSYAPYIYILQKMPMFEDYKWVTFGYGVFMSISIQYLGFGFAGIMRRISIYPERCLWQSVLPTLAVNRTLVQTTEKQKVNGWSISRFKFFVFISIFSFSWFIICNVLFEALHSFNWMTWISPQNFTLAMITGFYGGMGFSPLNTVDWSTSGYLSLVTPFFSQLSSMAGRIIGGLCIIGMYWSNYYWSAYLPLNSNELFTNNGTEFEVSNVMKDGKFDHDLYQSYSPAYYSAANIFVQGSWNAYFAILVCYIFVKDWKDVKYAFITMYKGLRYRKSSSSGCEDFKDVHCQMMAKYPEVPDWWFLAVLVINIVFAIILLTAYPEHTPVYTIFVVLAISFIWLIPTTLILAVANVGVSLSNLFQIFASLMAKNNPNAVLMIISYGYNTDGKTQGYINMLKAAHYAKVPPRAVFRGQIASTFISILVFIGVYTFQMSSFNDLCEWNQPQHFVCNNEYGIYSNIIEYGSFGVQIVYKLYPILPWCFLIGGLVGIFFALTQKYIFTFRDFCRKRMSEGTFEKFDLHFMRFARFYLLVNPAVIWAGSTQWTGGTNLSYYVTAFYLSIIFMWYIKNRYLPWWARYNYLLEAGMDVGVAIGAIFQFFAFGGIMPYGAKSISWWGNSISTSGVDYQAYQQNGALLPIPEKGYFGYAPGHYPE